MVFKTDKQRRGFFSSLNRFSVSNMGILSGRERVGVAMLAKVEESKDKIQKIADDPNIVVCDKYDGVRAMAVGVGSNNELFNPRKAGVDLSKKFPDVVEAISSYFDSHKPYIVEGEIVSAVHDKNDFHDVVGRVNASDDSAVENSAIHPVVFRVFDVLEIDNRDVKGLPLSARREVLENIIGDGNDIIKLEECTTVDKMNYADNYIASGGEGVIFKDLNSKYESGSRTGSWTKYKKPENSTFVVYGLLKGNGSNSNGVGSLMIGEYEGGKIVGRGRVGSGLSFAERSRLWSKYGGVNQKEIILPEGEMFGAEVRYMEMDTNGALRQPRVSRLREDIGIDAFRGAS